MPRALPIYQGKRKAWRINIREKVCDIRTYMLKAFLANGQFSSELGVLLGGMIRDINFFNSYNISQKDKVCMYSV